MDYLFKKAKSFQLPSFLFILFLVCFMVLFQVGDRKYYSLTRALSQWDGQHYLSIARDGYQVYPCGFNPDYVCGNVGWFPFYPLTGWIIALTGFNIRWVIILISWLSFWIALCMIFEMVRCRYNEKTAFISLLALLCFPGSFYFLTAFPYALFLLLTILVFYLLEKKKYTFLFLLTGFLAVTYPSGFVIGLPVLYYIVRDRKELNSSERLKLLLALGSIGLALFLYFFYYWYKFDDFFLYTRFQAQSYYAHQITFPLVVIYKTLTIARFSNPVWIILVFTMGTMIIFYTKKVPLSWQLFMFGILLFTPTFGTTTCYYRHIIVAFPMYVMVGHSINSKQRKYFLSIYFIGALILIWKVFLPAYKLGQLM